MNFFLSNYQIVLQLLQGGVIVKKKWEMEKFFPKKASSVCVFVFVFCLFVCFNLSHCVMRFRYIEVVFSYMITVVKKIVQTYFID